MSDKEKFLIEALRKIIQINIDGRYHPRTRQSLTVQEAEAAIAKAGKL